MVGSFLAEGDGEPQALRIGMSGSSAAPKFDLTLVDMSERRTTSAMWAEEGSRSS